MPVLRRCARTSRPNIPSHPRRLGRPLAGRRTIVRLTLAPSALSRSLPAPFAQTKGKAHATGGLQHLRPCNRPPHPAGDDLFPRPPPRVQGHKAVEIYTQAISACKIPGCVDWDRALSIFTLMQVGCACQAARRGMGGPWKGSQGAMQRVSVLVRTRTSRGRQRADSESCVMTRL